MRTPEEIKKLIASIKATLPKATVREARKLVKLELELRRRKIRALNLYQASDRQEEFHKDNTKIRIIRGGVRAGKTTAAAVEIARFALLCDPHQKYPTYKDTKGVAVRIFVVGYDNKHIGRKMYPALFKADAFKIIRDESGEWRAFDPIKDKDREHDAKPAPPLIPPSLIKETSWSNKASRVWDRIELVNGTEIYAFPSTGQEPQGDQIDMAWIDEDIQYPKWVDELQSRAIDRRGKMVISAMPHSRNTAMLDLSELAEAEADKKEPLCREYAWDIFGNVHLPQEEVERQVKIWASRGDQIVKVRAYGQFAANQWAVFKDFHIDIHGIDFKELPKEKGSGLFPPLDWCNIEVFDPGVGRCAILFATIPPPSSDFAKENGHNLVILYDELYISDSHAAKMAKQFKQKKVGHASSLWIIDEHGSRIREAGSGKTIKDQYRDALNKYHLKTDQRGCTFVSGSDNKQARLEAVYNWLHIRQNGTPKLRVVRGRLPWFEWEMKRYRFKVHPGDRDVPTDEPDDRRNNHLMVDLQYLAAHNPRYQKPKKKDSIEEGWAYRHFKEKQKKKQAKMGGTQVVLG